MWKKILQALKWSIVNIKIRHAERNDKRALVGEKIYVELEQLNK